MSLVAPKEVGGNHRTIVSLIKPMMTMRGSMSECQDGTVDGWGDNRGCHSIGQRKEHRFSNGRKSHSLAEIYT